MCFTASSARKKIQISSFTEMSLQSASHPTIADRSHSERTVSALNWEKLHTLRVYICELWLWRCLGIILLFRSCNPVQTHHTPNVTLCFLTHTSDACFHLYSLKGHFSVFWSTVKVVQQKKCHVGRVCCSWFTFLTGVFSGNLTRTVNMT